MNKTKLEQKRTIINSFDLKSQQKLSLKNNTS